MKSIIISDMHGENPCKVVRAEQKKWGIERAVFLGDYDTPEVFAKVRELKIPKILLVGNHDYSYITGSAIESRMMTGPWQSYARLWDSFRKEKSFMMDLIDGKIKNSRFRAETKAGKNKIVYGHASLAEGITWFGEPIGLWQRIKEYEFPPMNFKEMEKNNYLIFFRGHDHRPGILSSNGDEKVYGVNLFQKQTIGKDKKHIITVGAFYDGCYVLFDDKSGAIEFRQ